MEKNKNLICRILMLCATVFFAYDVSAQTIKGHVEEASGVEIIGASIMEKGTTNGTVTDIDGNFQLNCKPGAKLVISYVGFTTQEVAAVDGMKVVLQEDNTTLNEVVVIGYGSLAKKEISSSVVQINKDQFNQGAVQDPMGLVAGKVTGLNVSATNDADPNGMTSIQVRGAGSLKASNGPLIVIDGIAGGDLRNVASQDVESITVLKDAGSAAIYGTRGANGVILVTTKKGASGEGVTNVTYDSYIALNFAKPHAKILSPDEFRRSRRGTDYGYDTDWYDLISRPVSYNLNQYVSVDGSTKNGFYSASLNYKKGNGLDIASGREEYGGRFVVEQRALNKLLTFNTSLSARRVHEDWGNNDTFDRALTMNPTMPVYNEDGSYYAPMDVTGARNPVSVLNLINNKGDRNYILGNADIKLQILRSEHHNLNTSLSYALQYNDLKSHYYAPSTADESRWGEYAGNANIKNEKWWTNRLEWLGNYILSLKDHELKAVIGYSWERSKYEGHYLEDKDFTYDNLDYLNIGKGTYNANGKTAPWASKTESTLIGFFGRLNYNWRDMLYVSASLRHEGSTKFGKDRKWGNFPAASIAWEITRTPGLDKLGETFQSLKPRISYGVTGRSDFSEYQSLATYSSRTGYYMDGAWTTGYAPSVNANPDLGWEKASAFNLGVDFVTVNGRLRGSIEYYDRRSQDLLWDYTAPQPPFIYDRILVNVGTTKNSGFEAALDFDVFNKKPFTWTTGINYTYGITKMTKLSNDIYKSSYIDLYQKPGVGASEYFFRIEEGAKVGQIYGYEYAGTDENGNMLVYNKNGEAVTTNAANAEDKKYIGNGAPPHFLSWTNSLSYKNFDLSFLFRGAFGFDIFNMRKYGMGLQGCGTDNVLRQAYLDDKDVKTGGGVISSYFLEKGDYFKLDNVTLGYTFIPKKRHLLESLRVYLTAKNLFTITGYKGNDPSIVPQNGITPGIDVSTAYPQATQVSLGLTVKFH
jgi:TonB-linked SusC/RagA family outer membrane protein